MINSAGCRPQDRLLLGLALEIGTAIRIARKKLAKFLVAPLEYSKACSLQAARPSEYLRACHPCSDTSMSLFNYVSRSLNLGAASLHTARLPWGRLSVVATDEPSLPFSTVLK